jgi:hypothetical protein
VCNTQGTITFGTTNITFAQISSAQVYSAGTGLTLTGTQFSITNTGTAGTYGSASSVPVLVTNAQGQVTSVTPTAIAIAADAVSGLAASATMDTTDAANITSGTLPVARLNGSYTGITGVGTLAAGTWNGSTIAAGYGGTGLTSFTANGVVYASTTSTLITGSALTFDGAQLGVNGVTVGRGAGAISTHTAVGTSALGATAAGNNSVAFGYQAAFTTTMPFQSVYIGSGAGYSISGSNEGGVYIGYQAGNRLTTGANYNVAIGHQALYGAASSEIGRAHV